MLEHAEMINAIMMDMSPGVVAMCCVSYTVDHVKAYFRKVREDQMALFEERLEN